MYNSNSKLYRVWTTMRQRCRDQKATGYSSCGGKGIQVCSEWQSFSNFAEWSSSNGYSEGKSLSRVDLNKDFCPENCNWISKDKSLSKARKALRRKEDKEQLRKNYFYRGKYRTITELSEITGISFSILYDRLFSRGMQVSEALTFTNSATMYYYDGKLKTLREWAEVTGISYSALYTRLVRLNWEVSKAFTTPAKVKSKKR
ncbi:hypothetical protein [Bacillus phage phiAGATE]|uniref:Uncharacterized protein n=1 Tax=Bacillus phage phiAGATE TaxID=1204533 RepID=L0LC15_9CAUD|nr:HNH endonuclease [Bacillus phage phiAGATE]AGB62616.1 hypothetical protein [Bacillus phage phiAGATE]